MIIKYRSYRHISSSTFIKHWF